MNWASLQVFELDGSREVATEADEMLVLPLAGSCSVSCGGEKLELTGRASVFDGVTDFAYLPPNSTAAIEGKGRFALPGARATKDLPFRYGPAQDVAVELRGAGSCSRQINNFCMEDTFEAGKLLACEVITPAGNWSSYPPHKHDQDRPGESVLEEIYYFEVGAAGVRAAGVRAAGVRAAGSGAGSGEQGFGFMRVYGSDDSRPIDMLTQVRSGDVVLVPYGWHGPAIAAPGHDMYYLNVMAGAERRWLICDDPAHAWIRDTWASQPVDPRLPWRST